MVEKRSGMFELFVVEMVLVALVVWWLARTERDISGLNKVFNLGSMILISVMLMTWIGSHMSSHQVAPRERCRSSVDIMEMITNDMQPIHPPQGKLPDIYYIVLDGYGRQDVLQSIYGIDNQEFMDFLVSNGFYIADNASSNYMGTAHSMSVHIKLYVSWMRVATQMGLESEQYQNHFR